METTVNERLMAIMNEYKLNPYSFSRRIDVAKSTVSEYFKDGSTREPSLSVLQKVTAAFVEISPLWLYEGKGEMMISDNLPHITGNESEEVLDLHAQIAKLTAGLEKVRTDLSRANRLIDNLQFALEMQRGLTHEAHEDYIEEKNKKEIV